MELLAHSQSNAKQRGGVLVIFAMLVFGLMAIAALVIDLGLASATQGQMQAAVDSAALEGMRARNTTANGTPQHIEVIPFIADSDRRMSARQLVRLAFDADLDLIDPSPDAYSVGPELTMIGGVGNVDAFALIDLQPNQELQDPWLDTNDDIDPAKYNLAQGDMVAGNHDPNDGNFNPITELQYANEANGFLVRMRRTGEGTSGDPSWIGPTIPYLFGRGSLIRADGTNSARKDGIAVRATAIATGQPALQVGSSPDLGPAYSGRKLRGLVKIAFDRSCWKRIRIETDSPECVAYERGVISFDCDRDGVDDPIGMFYREIQAGDPSGELPGIPAQVGRVIVPYYDSDGEPPLGQPDLTEADLRTPGWAPLYDDIFDGVETRKRVIGFVYVELGGELHFENPGDPCEGKRHLWKYSPTVASHNASACFPNDPVSLSGVGWDAIFLSRRDELEIPDDPDIYPLNLLLAPAISR